MDRDLAKHVVQVGFHSLALLQGLLPLLKEHCPGTEYDEYLRAIASVSGHMSTDIFNSIFAKYPDLEKEVEAKVQKYGKFI